MCTKSLKAEKKLVLLLKPTQCHLCQSAINFGITNDAFSEPFELCSDDMFDGFAIIELVRHFHLLMYCHTAGLKLGK